jgi:hypothetical protein
MHIYNFGCLCGSPLPFLDSAKLINIKANSISFSGWTSMLDKKEKLKEIEEVETY